MKHSHAIFLLFAATCTSYAHSSRSLSQELLLIHQHKRLILHFRKGLVAQPELFALALRFGSCAVGHCARCAW